MKERRRIVRVSARSVAAYEEPVFVVKARGKFFLTLGVLEFDPEHEGITPEQRRTIREMEKLFEKEDCVDAVLVKRASHFHGANTGPEDDDPE